MYNENQHSSDYDNLREVFRPSHADYTYTQKYGVRDHRGGGRSSARETIARCVAGASCKTCFNSAGHRSLGVYFAGGELSLSGDYNRYDFDEIEKNPVRCPDADMAKRMEEYIGKVKSEGDTVGGVVTCVVRHVPAGLGEPVFDKPACRIG